MRKFLTVTANGVILWIWSEFLFWSVLRPSDTVQDHLITCAAYCLLAYAFLEVVARFEVRGLLALLLAGGIYGWLAEGVVVSTMYDELPWQITWTGLSWHGLISVLAGWYGMRRMLAHGRFPRVALAAGVMGVAWGLWSIWWPGELGFWTSNAVFAAGAFLFTGVLAAAHAVAARCPLRAYEPGRVGPVLVVTLFALQFLLAVVPGKPHALLIMPPVLALTFLLLARMRKGTSGPTVFERLDGPVPWRHVALLFIAPAVATAIYALCHAVRLAPPTHWPVYILTQVTAAALYLWAIVRGVRGGARAGSPASV